ncbi:unnamed protein product [Linum tenue]|uniref:Uncharacterized protein n=1 Tax=Linum tenue TaxID=586396 RepID=A0AAV0JYS3_9ROSI|nr:unnamed protein product [Linum tenue]
MNESSITTPRFTYINDQKGPSAAIDMHHVIVRQSNLKALLVCLLAFCFPANGFYLFMVLWKSIAPFRASEQDCKASVAGACESGHLLLAFVYDFAEGRRTDSGFQGMHTSSSHFSDFQNPLQLAFMFGDSYAVVVQELHPPLKMLVPIWKALCGAVSGDKDSSLHSSVEDYGQSVFS